MLKVYRISRHEYAILFRGHRRIGSLADTILAMRKLGTVREEIEQGLLSLSQNQHRLAHYGVGNRFAYSE